MRIISLIIDNLFPPRDTELQVRNATSLALTLQRAKRHIFLSSFKDPLVAAAITENKFYRNQSATRLLASLLENWLATQATHIILIPIPLSRKRQKGRGHNQVTSVIEQLANNTTHTLVTDLLYRKVHTKPQTSLRKSARQQNMKNVFAVRTPKDWSVYKGQFVILDDVTTTGATLTSAYDTLRSELPANFPLITVALAH